MIVTDLSQSFHPVPKSKESNQKSSRNRSNKTKK